MTAQTLIDKALEKAGIVSPGGTPTTNQRNAALADLNPMAVAWRKYGLTTWARASHTFNLTNGDGDYTVGSGLDVDIARPVRILGAYYTRNGKDTALTQVSKSDYFGLTDKTTSGLPVQFWYNQDTPATLYLWPVPNEDGLTCTLDYHVPLTAMALGDTLDVPAEWDEAFVFNLAVRLCPTYGRTASKELLSLAKETLDLATGSNTEETSVRFEPEVWE
jgi:hypothetical protein